MKTYGNVCSLQNRKPLFRNDAKLLCLTPYKVIVTPFTAKLCTCDSLSILNFPANLLPTVH